MTITSHFFNKDEQWFDKFYRTLKENQIEPAALCDKCSEPMYVAMMGGDGRHHEENRLLCCNPLLCNNCYEETTGVGRSKRMIAYFGQLQLQRFELDWSDL